MEYPLVKILSIVFCALSLVFSVFLITVSTEKRISNYLLAGFLLLISVDISFFWYSDHITLHPILEMLRIRIAILKSPVLFLYILSVLYVDFGLKKIHALHLLPFVVSIIVLFPRFFLAARDEQLLFFQDYINMPEVSFIQFIGHVVFLGYTFASIFYIVRYKRIVVANYTEGGSLENYKWLSQLMSIIVLVSILTLVKDLSKGLKDLEMLGDLRVAMLVGGIIFMTWLFLKGLHSPSIFRGIDADIAKRDDDVQSHDRVVLLDQKDRQLESLKNYLLEHEPYLKPSLTIGELAELTGIPQRNLSELINVHYGQHFFDFINGHRIRKATEILKDPTKSDLSVKEIMYEVGFNSKNSFYSSFKKVIGQTPTQFRKAPR